MSTNCFMQRYRLANHNYRRRLDQTAILFNIAQISNRDSLSCPASLFNNSHRRRRIDIPLQKQSSDFHSPFNPHQYDQCACRPKQGEKIRGAAFNTRVPRDYGKRVCNPPVGNGDPGKCRHRDRAADPGNDFNFDSSGGEVHCFLAPASKDKWISSFETHHLFARRCQLGKQFIDPLLKPCVLPRFLSDVNSLCVIAGLGQQAGINKSIIYNRIGIAQAFKAPNSYQPRISGACPHNKHFANHVLSPSFNGHQRRHSILGALHPEHSPCRASGVARTIASRECALRGLS